MPESFRLKHARQVTHLADWARQLLAKHADGIEFTCRPIGRKRSNSQNDMLHGMLQVACEALSASPDIQGCTLSVDELKRALTARWHGERAIELYGLDLRVSVKTSKLTEAQMSDLIDFVRAWAAEYRIPTERNSDEYR